MSRKKTKNPAAATDRQTEAKPQEKSDTAAVTGNLQVPPPVDVVDGIADRSAGRPARIYLLLAGVYIAWLAFLAYCAVGGSRV